MRGKARAPRPTPRDRGRGSAASGAGGVEDARAPHRGIQPAVLLQGGPVARRDRVPDRGQLRRLVVDHHHGLWGASRPPVEYPLGRRQQLRVAAHDDDLDGAAGRGEGQPQRGMLRAPCADRALRLVLDLDKDERRPARRRARSVACGESTDTARRPLPGRVCAAARPWRSPPRSTR